MEWQRKGELTMKVKKRIWRKKKRREADEIRRI